MELIIWYHSNLWNSIIFANSRVLWHLYNATAFMIPGLAVNYSK
jgi:hypothetical protein